MTEKTIDWLNQNRFRAYPFVNDNGLIDGAERVPDAVLLDCMVMDTRKGAGQPSLVFTKYVITEAHTEVHFTYGNISSSITIYPHGDSSDSDPTMDATFGDGSFVRYNGSGIFGPSGQFVHMTMTFSSHEYIMERVGVGVWNFTGTVLPTKVISVEASGVSGIKTNGSYTVAGAGTAVGTVHLKDGYRTQPVISNGKVIVRVGTRYGLDPCHYPKDYSHDVPCSDMLTFFCGQTGDTSGNIMLSGGPGINVTQGGVYTAKSDILDSYGTVGIEAGESVPCIEISASSELMRIYRPTTESSESTGASS